VNLLDDEIQEGARPASGVEDVDLIIGEAQRLVELLLEQVVNRADDVRDTGSGV